MAVEEFGPERARELAEELAEGQVGVHAPTLTEVLLERPEAAREMAEERGVR